MPAPRAVGWVLAAAVTAMGAIAVLAAFLPSQAGDARWEMAVLGPVARACLWAAVGLCLAGVLAVAASLTRLLAIVLVVAALYLALLVIGVLTVALDLWLLATPSTFGRAASEGLQVLGVYGILQGVIAAAAMGALLRHFSAAFHALRLR